MRMVFHDGRVFVDYNGVLKDVAFIEKKIKRYFDYLDRHDFVYAWGGNVYTTDDTYPAIGKVDDCIFVNTGHGYYGLSYAMLGGLIMADYIERGQTQIKDANLFSVTRFLKEDK